MAKGKLQKIEIPGLPLDERSLRYADDIISHPGVENMLLLPDALTKEKYINAPYKVTIPSSSVIVTDTDHLYPQFRSRGINCGMMAIVLPFQEEEMNELFIRAIEKELLYSISYYVNYRLRLPFIKGRYDLDYPSFLKVLEEGAPVLMKRLGVREEDVAALEWGRSSRRVDLASTRKYFREEWLTKRTVRMRYSFGKYFGGNHYFELQAVEDPGPEEFGLQKGQMVAMVHTGCEAIEDVVRTDLRETFIRKGTYQSVSKESEMYEAFFLAQDVLKNLISAHRLTTFAIIRDVVGRVYRGAQPPRVIIEKGHNHTHKEVHDGREVLVYRHNAEILKEGGYAIVSGDRQHASYLVKGGGRLSQFYNTIDHGLGSILEKNTHEDSAGKESVVVRRAWHGLRNPLFNTQRREPFLKSPLAERYLSFMKERGIIASHATLRPVYNLKYTT